MHRLTPPCRACRHGCGLSSGPWCWCCSRWTPCPLYNSNAFAILGLRALYLVLAGTVGTLRYLHYDLAGVLAFAGLKMVLEPWLHAPPMTSVLIIVTLITGAVWASQRARRREARAAASRPGAPVEREA